MLSTRQQRCRAAVSPSTPRGKHSVEMGAEGEEMGKLKTLPWCSGNTALYLLQLQYVALTAGFLAAWSSPGRRGSLPFSHTHGSGAGRSPSAAHRLLPTSRDTRTRGHRASSRFTFQVRIGVCRSREIYHRGRDTGASFKESFSEVQNYSAGSESESKLKKINKEKTPHSLA